MVPASPGVSDQRDNEYILDLTPTYIPQTHLVAQFRDIACDYYWGEQHDDPSPAVRKKAKAGDKPFPKYSHRTPVMPSKSFVVRRGIAGNRLVPLCHTHLIRAELEIEAYSRELFEHGWDHQRIISCPVLIFIDGFGLYRNSYRYLVGVYAIITSMSGEDIHRQANIFPPTLSPHSSNFDDMIRSLQSLGTLDCGQRITINGEDVVIYIPTLGYLGDLPQQDKSSSFRGPKALKFCRFYAIGQQAVKSAQPNGVLDFDIVTHGRYHRQLIEMRKRMDSLNTAAKRGKYGSQ